MRTSLGVAAAVWLGLLCLATEARADVADDVARALATARDARLSVLVVDVASGRVVFERDPQVALVPASNMKVLTTAAAFLRLGSEFAHETRVLGPRPDGAGVVRGDLVVVGAGDPTISRRFDPEPLLSDWADALFAAGVRRVEGDLVLDDRTFGDVRYHPAWSAADREHWYGAEVTALSLNDNCLDVEVAGSADGPLVRTYPETAYVRLDVRATRTEREREHVFSFARLPSRVAGDPLTIRVTGRVWDHAGPNEGSVPVVDPTRFFGAVLRERLAARGIDVSGATRRALPEERPAGHELYVRRAPLLRTLAVTNQRSQNLYAECLLRTLGARLGAGGTWPEGARVVAAFAREQGVPEGEVVVSDGSGLSREDRLSARALVTVLRAVLRRPEGSGFLASFAAPGEEGTLRGRLRDLPAGVRLRAKTGTLTGVTALSGVLEAGPRRLAFSFIANGGADARPAIDRAVRALAASLATE